MFTAFRDHASYLGVKIGLRERLFFYKFRYYWYGVKFWQPTPIGCVADVVSKLSQRSIPDFYNLIIECEVYKWYEVGGLGVIDGIDIEPAIYFSLNTKHPYFTQI